MSPRSARAVSTAVVGGLAAMLFFSQGLLIWAGLVGWAAILDSRPEAGETRKTIGSMVFGALLGWAALMMNDLIPVPTEGWLWIPRIGVSVAAGLLILVLASGTPLISRVSASILGFATVFGATAIMVAGEHEPDMLLAPHQDNPLINAVLSVIGGVLCGLLSNKLTSSMSDG